MRKKIITSYIVSKYKIHAKGMFTYVIEAYSHYVLKKFLEKVMADKGFLPGSETTVMLNHANFRSRSQNRVQRLAGSLKRRSTTFQEYYQDHPTKGRITQILHINVIKNYQITGIYSEMKDYDKINVISSKKKNKKLKRHLTTKK